MKRFLVAFFMGLITVTGFADNGMSDSAMCFTSDEVENAINTKVVPENRQSAANAYEENMFGGCAITIEGMYKVCIAAGFDITTLDGYEQCRDFVTFLIDVSHTWKGVGYNDCVTVANGTPSDKGCVGRDGQMLKFANSCMGDDGECVTVFANLQTTDAMAREFINVYGQRPDVNKMFTCMAGHNNGDTAKVTQDYMQCSAGGEAFEFEFDDLSESVLESIVRSEAEAICTLYGGQPSIYMDMVITNPENAACNNVSEDVCLQHIKPFAERVGHAVSFGRGGGLGQETCLISIKLQVVQNLVTMQGVSSDAFRKVQLTVDLAIPLLEQYLRSKRPKAYSIGCDPVIRSDGKWNDVLTCTVDGERVDFVFDDLVESMDYEIKAGVSGMECVINGGVHKGKTCSNLTPDMCKQVNSKISGGTTWDAENQRCLLNDVADAEKIDFVINTVGGAVGVVVAVVLTGGTVTFVLVGIGGDVAYNVGFEAAMNWVEANPNRQASKFLKSAQNCNDAECAKKIIVDFLATIETVKEDLDNPDVKAACSSEMGRLKGLFSEDEFIDIVEKIFCKYRN